MLSEVLLDVYYIGHDGTVITPEYIKVKVPSFNNDEHVVVDDGFYSRYVLDNGSLVDIITSHNNTTTNHLIQQLLVHRAVFISYKDDSKPYKFNYDNRRKLLKANDLVVTNLTMSDSDHSHITLVTEHQYKESLDVMTGFCNSRYITMNSTNNEIDLFGKIYVNAGKMSYLEHIATSRPMLLKV